MSYCGPRWISLYTHTFLVNATGLMPQTIPTGSGAAGERVIRDDEPIFARSADLVAPLIHVLGRVDEDGAVDVTSVARIETSYLVGRGEQTAYVAQLVGEDGAVIAEDRLYRYDATGCGCGGCGGEDRERSFVFKAMLDDRGPGESLRIVREGEVVWERKRPPHRCSWGRRRRSSWRVGRSMRSS